jgi:hypothetical protein
MGKEIGNNDTKLVFFFNLNVMWGMVFPNIVPYFDFFLFFQKILLPTFLTALHTLRTEQRTNKRLLMK